MPTHRYLYRCVSFWWFTSTETDAKVLSFWVHLRWGFDDEISGANIPNFHQEGHQNQFRIHLGSDATQSYILNKLLAVLQTDWQRTNGFVIFEGSMQSLTKHIISRQGPCHDAASLKACFAVISCEPSLAKMPPNIRIFLTAWHLWGSRIFCLSVERRLDGWGIRNKSIFAPCDSEIPSVVSGRTVFCCAFRRGCSKLMVLSQVLNVTSCKSESPKCIPESGNPNIAGL